MLEDGRVFVSVMAHYLDPPDEPGHELPPARSRGGGDPELVRFLASFTGEIAAESRWLAPPRDL